METWVYTVARHRSIPTFKGETQVPPTRLSKADQEEARKLQQKPVASNPFEP